MSPIRPCIVLVILGTLFTSVPAKAADTDAAIQKGAQYLEGAIKSGAITVEYKVGGSALVGMALLEAGMKPDSPGVAAITKQLREVALAQTETYPVALCILYFDKLAEKTGDSVDEGIIQILGIRLYAGLNSSGGWGYNTWEAVSAQELTRLSAALQKNELSTKAPEKPVEEPKKSEKPDDGFLKPGTTKAPVQAGNGKLHPEAATLLTQVKQTIQARGRSAVMGDDNSNTQFGLIGLWVASRHGLTVNDAFAMIEARFLQTQSANDAGWSYNSMPGVRNSTPAMTCAGLLGLAVGAGTRNSLKAEKNKDKPVDPAKPTDDDPFSNPKAKPDKPNKGIGRPAELALSSLGKFLGATRANAAPAPGRGGADPQGIRGLQDFVGAGNGFYLLWSVERVAMAYALDTIGGVDWYAWGCGFLLPAQGQDGSWGMESYGHAINTSFAILFLTKSNSVRDLSNKIKGKVRDPGKTELRSGAGSGAPALFAPAPKEGAKTEPKPDPKLAGPGFTLPAVLPLNEEVEIEKVATALGTATDETWKVKLEEARDSKGAKWTRGLAKACNQLEAEKLLQAREALAERLTRMTAKTLRELLNDADAELRRAACLAVAMREEKSLILAVIERITDPSEIVVRAAKASLKSISQADFGPVSGASDEAKVKAAALWRTWYEALPK